MSAQGILRRRKSHYTAQSAVVGAIEEERAKEREV
jgi:hypothetical protein